MAALVTKSITLFSFSYFSTSAIKVWRITWSNGSDGRGAVFPSPLHYHKCTPTSCGHQTCSCIYHIPHQGSCACSALGQHRERWAVPVLGVHGSLHVPCGSLGIGMSPRNIPCGATSSNSGPIPADGTDVFEPCTWKTVNGVVLAQGRSNLCLFFDWHRMSPPFIFYRRQGPWPLCHATVKYCLTQNLRSPCVEFRVKPWVLLLEAAPVLFHHCENRIRALITTNTFWDRKSVV